MDTRISQLGGWASLIRKLPKVDRKKQCKIKGAQEVPYKKNIGVIKMKDKDLLLYIQQQQQEETNNWAEDLINSLNLD